MPISAAEREASVSASRGRGASGWKFGCGGLAVVLLCVGGYFVNAYWPYRYKQVQPLLENVFASQIKIAEYHRIYFPHPGFVAKGLVLQRKSAMDLPPVGSARDLIVRGSWVDLLLLRDRVELVDVVGLHIIIPPVGSDANHQEFPQGSSADFAGPTTAVGQLHLHDTLLEIERVRGGKFSFPIRDLVIRNLQKGRQVSYAVDMQNAMPGGHILSKGKFGPLTPSNLGGTPLSGDFTFTEVKLSDIGDLHGTLSASDHFEGTLAAIKAKVSTKTADFAVGDGRPTPLTATVEVMVNGLDGGVMLHGIDAEMGKTMIHAEGSVLAAAANAPKTTKLDLSVKQGRVEDLLRPFLHGRPPVVGAVWMKAHAELPPGAVGESFLDRLRMSGGFHVPAERLTDRKEEQTLSGFSQRAQGVKDEEADADVLSSLGGTVTMTHGVVAARGFTFQVPGAVANLDGTYNVKSTAVHLTGDLRMDTDLSHVTTGFKSVLLKPFAPFFKKGTKGAVIPVAITGSSGSYKVGADLGHRK